MNIENATHWIPGKNKIKINNNFISVNLTPNKPYELIKLKCSDTDEYEYFIKDDKGNYTMDYMVCEGKFIVLHKGEIRYA